ncbi:hypothetical protein H4V95_000966 [Arthrobacter sp. CAN_C5]|nr:hypothetical protein [Arthrobacter sp. CAN_C5]
MATRSSHFAIFADGQDLLAQAEQDAAESLLAALG